MKREPRESEIKAEAPAGDIPPQPQEPVTQPEVPPADEPLPCDPPEGEIRLCRPLEDGRFALIYSSQIWRDGARAPIFEDTLCLYDPAEGTYDTVYVGEDLWEAGSRLARREGALYLCNGSRIYAFSPEGGWHMEDLTPDPAGYYALSPDGDRYALRGETGVEVFDLLTGERLAALEDLRDLAGMAWSEDGSGWRWSPTWPPP